MSSCLFLVAALSETKGSHSSHQDRNCGLQTKLAIALLRTAAWAFGLNVLCLPKDLEKPDCNKTLNYLQQWRTESHRASPSIPQGAKVPGSRQVVPPALWAEVV